jgi:DNA-binding MarR family transcriptional regulator
MKHDISSISFLISIVHAHTASFLKKRLNEEGLEKLATSHGHILFQLAVHEELSMSEIARFVYKDKSTTTALCKKLEEIGLIERKQSKQDKRQTKIRLSEKGRQYEDSLTKISQELTETAFLGFSEAEKKEMIEKLDAIKANFQRLEDEPKNS